MLVTEKLTDSVDVFSVQNNGTLSAATVNKNPQPGVFDVVFAPGGAALVVQTAGAGAVNGSSISSYIVEDDRTLSPLTPILPTLGAASCWVALTADGHFAFTSNAGTATLSGFKVDTAGNLTALANTVVATLPAGSTNLDIAVSADAKYAYTLNNGTGTVGVFAIQPDGTLKSLGFAPGLAAAKGYNGIAAL